MASGNVFKCFQKFPNDWELCLVSHTSGDVGPGRLLEHQKVGPPHPFCPGRCKTLGSASQEMGSPEDMIRIITD